MSAEHAAANAHAALVAEVREDAQADAPLREAREAIGDRLGDRVDEVRAHRVAAVDDDVNDDHLVFGLAEGADLEVARSAAARAEARNGAVGLREDLVLGGEDGARRAPRVLHVRELHLADHQRRVDLGAEAAAGADHLRGVRGGGDDARLLDDHRDDVVLVVDAHVERDAVGQAVRAEDVLDELVRGLGLEASAVERARDLVRLDARGLGHELATLVDGHLVEAGQLRSALRHDDEVAAADRDERRGLRDGPHSFLIQCYVDLEQPERARTFHERGRRRSASNVGRDVAAASARDAEGRILRGGDVLEHVEALGDDRRSRSDAEAERARAPRDGSRRRGARDCRPSRRPPPRAR